jgi:pimeloyl-ACP methyl ester carboxylesterase
MTRPAPPHPAPPTRSLRVGRGPVEVADVPAAPGVEAAPLVFLHEGLGSLALWRDFPWAVQRATGRRTVVYSRHGHGRSAVVREPRRPDYLHHEALEVLPALLERLDVRRPVLVGHSDGASIALIHAGAAPPDAVAGVVAMAPHVVVEDKALTGIAATDRVFAGGELRERLARHHVDADATYHGWRDIWQAPEFRAWDITDVLPGVACPALLIQGRQDPYATMRQLDLVEAGVRGPVTRLELDDCGHAPQAERPEPTRAAVLAWLERFAC